MAKKRRFVSYYQAFANLHFCRGHRFSNNSAKLLSMLMISQYFSFFPPFSSNDWHFCLCWLLSPTGHVPPWTLTSGGAISFTAHRKGTPWFRIPIWLKSSDIPAVRARASDAREKTASCWVSHLRSWSRGRIHPSLRQPQWLVSGFLCSPGKWRGGLWLTSSLDFGVSSIASQGWFRARSWTQNPDMFSCMCKRCETFEYALVDWWHTVCVASFCCWLTCIPLKRALFCQASRRSYYKKKPYIYFREMSC